MSGPWKRLLRVPRPVDRQAIEDVEAEIEFHLDARTDELVADGVHPATARARAEAEFGDLRDARSALVPAARRRERRRRLGRWADELRRDVSEAARGLRKAPAFAAVSIATLALAIGANTGVFSVAHAVLFRPLPYHDPDRIVQVTEAELPHHPRNHISSATYIDWKNESTSFVEFGAYSFQLPLVLTDPDAPPRHVETVRMTPAAFRTLGVSPILGRLFTEDEGHPGAPRRAVLSWPFWQTQYGADEDVLGRVITLDDQDYEIVGVMGPRFAFPDHDVEVWPSLRFAQTSDGQNRSAHQWEAVGRLASGVSAARADAELDAISARLEQSYPESMTNWRARVQVFRADLTRSVRPLVAVLLGVVVTVLLVACANLANLMLARFTAQRRELAVRSALGAGRARLVRRALVESGILSLAGGALGLATAVGLTRLFVAMAPPDIPLLSTTSVDGTVLAFAALATFGSTILFGLVPALRATHVDPASVLQEGRRGSSGGRSQARLRRLILVSEMALTSLLLIGAGLLVRSMIELQRIEYGFDPDDLTAATLRLPIAVYPTLEEQLAVFEPLRDRLASIPGVAAAAATAEPPVVGYQMSFGYAVEGKPRTGPERMEEAIQLRAITDGYFETIGQAVLHGRPFEASDRATSMPVAIINESLAALHWAGEDPVGGRISTQSPEGAWREIIGVVADTRHRGAAEPEPALYIPYAQKDWVWMTWQTFLIRSEGGAPVPREAVEAAVWTFDRSLALERFQPVVSLYADSRARSRFAMQLMVSFAGLALLLGSIGLYGILAYTVGQRRREIGVRMALGAGRGSITTLVIRDGLTLAVTGLAIGVGFSLLATRVLESLLYGIEPRDGLTFVAIPLVLVAVAAVASWLPARRAAHVEPASVLREG